MNLALVQTDLIWQDKAANRQNIGKMIEENTTIVKQADILILPEMFTTGFTMAASKLAESMDGDTIHWMRSLADQYQIAVCGSMIAHEDGKFFNRFVWFSPESKEVLSYDKKHLFSLADENHHFHAGTDHLEIEYKNWRIMPFICYDLRFPVWMRNTQEVDLMICVANFPTKRKKAWSTLLPARAIENVCYVAGVNIIGRDGNEIEYPGCSGVFDYTGELLLDAKSDKAINFVSIDKPPLDVFRRAYPFLKDRDHFNLLQNH